MNSGPRCAGCAHFVGSAAQLERRLAGLASLGSAHASVRDRDGLCLRHDRYVAADSTCVMFRARTGEAGQPRLPVSWPAS